MKRVVAFFAILALFATHGFTAEPPLGDGRPAPLRMEELEVRGLREKPEVLYLPVPRGIDIPSPVRYDLFLDDMTRPVFPWEFSSRTPQADGTLEPGNAP
jgi:hypothetical protein